MAIILHQHRFVKALHQALRQSCGLQGGERLLVAVSGGPDSTALLRALAALAGRKPWQFDLHVGHVHHHLRPSADDDARFVARLADTLGLACHRLDVHPADLPGNLESAARRLRYRALADLAGRLDADALLTAHQADDQLETLLMRLVRGCSLTGLTGIAPRRRLGRLLLCRPMLGLTRRQALAFLDDLDQPWQQDPTNNDPTRWRARLRHQVLPVLADLRPDASLKASQTAEHLQRIAGYLARQTGRYLRRHIQRPDNQTARLDRSVARRTDPVLLACVVRRLSVEMGCGADRLPGRLIDAIVSAARLRRGQTQHFTLAHGLTLTIDAQHLLWHRRRPS